MFRLQSINLTRFKLSPIKRNASFNNTVKLPVNITPTAQQKLHELIKRKPNAIGIELAVKKRGCNGFSHVINYLFNNHLNDPKANFFQLTHDNSKFLVKIPHVSEMHLVGSTMDFRSTATATEFFFSDPKASTCGCGQSFTK